MGDTKVKKRATGLPRIGKKKYPADRVRLQVSVRILPITRAALDKIGSENPGRAIDDLVEAFTLKHGVGAFARIHSIISKGTTPVTQF